MKNIPKNKNCSLLSNNVLQDTRHLKRHDRLTYKLLMISSYFPIYLALDLGIFDSILGVVRKLSHKKYFFKHPTPLSPLLQISYRNLFCLNLHTIFDPSPLERDVICERPFS